MIIGYICHKEEWQIKFISSTRDISIFAVAWEMWQQHLKSNQKIHEDFENKCKETQWCHILALKFMIIESV